MKPLKASIPAVIALLLFSAILVWNEARKEVLFLCANFAPDVTGASVIRQLETGHFLRYRRGVGENGEIIVMDSAYTLGVHVCTIELDADGTVVRASVE